MYRVMFGTMWSDRLHNQTRWLGQGGSWCTSLNVSLLNKGHLCINKTPPDNVSTAYLLPLQHIQWVYVWHTHRMTCDAVSSCHYISLTISFFRRNSETWYWIKHHLKLFFGVWMTNMRFTCFLLMIRHHFNAHQNAIILFPSFQW